jgi:tetratricopeptide (TPR) repeat protein
MTNNRRKKKSKRNQLLTRQTSSQQMTSASEKALAHSMSNEVRIFKWLLFAFPFLFGLFFEVTAILAGIVLAIFLLYLIKKNGRIRIALNLNSVLLIFVFLSYLLVLPWSVDWGIGLIGFMKFSTVILFIFVLMQFERSEIADCFNVIPWVGCVMVILTGMTYFIPELAGYFIDAGRLGGFFQYANTFALFLLLGIIVLAESNRITAIEISKMAVLTGGMLLTGSRISLLMLLGVLLYYAVFSKKMRKTAIIFGAVGLAIIAGLFLLSGSLSAVTRITTVFSDSSTLLGRLLYARDACFMLLKHPLGTGYMGYYYLQPQFQTGVYTTRFVHQEFFQLGLDAGIPAMLAFLVVCLRSLFSKKLLKMEKIILVVMLFHACLDFDFQYLIMLFILMMTLDLGKSRAYPAASVLMTARVFLIALGLVYTYFFAALLTERLGYLENALKMVPFNTEIKIYALSQAQTEESCEYWSDQILAQNKTIALAYEGRATVAVSRNDFDAMAENMDKVLLNDPYQLEKYQKYLEMLETAMNYYNDKGDTEKLKKFAQIALSMPERLNEVKSRTSSLAYLIDEKPNLDLTDKEQVYLMSLKKVMDEIGISAK